MPENESFVRDKLRLIWSGRQKWRVFSNVQCFVQSALPDRYDTEPKTLEWILDMAVVAIDQDGVSLLLLDQWNEIERAKPKDMLMTDYIGLCLMYLKQFCRKYSVTVILVAHPTKAVSRRAELLLLPTLRAR